MKVVKAEMKKQHKNYFHNKAIYISLFVWPMLTFIGTYYAYKPFNIEKIADSISYINTNNVILFVLVGYVTMMFFRCLVQSAWRFSFERTNGTLELIYMTPSNRLAFVMGNAVSSVFESVWLFVVFAICIVFVKGEYFNINVPSVILGIILMIVLSMLWGMFLNSLFLYSRDSGFLFTILEEPMEIFAGIKVPVNIFPIWAKLISTIFPLTYSAEILRRALLNNETLIQLKGFIIISIVCAVIMFWVTVLCLKFGERYARKTGNMALF
jgi:ABC-2 type transport system permease protein